MVGNNSEAGTSAACCSREAQHGIAVLSADATLIEDMDIRRVWGDCVYVNYRSGLAGDWSDGVTFRDSSCTLTGRHGVGIIAGKNLRIERNVFDQIGFMIVDIEPNDSSGGASDVLVADNTIGSYGLTDQYVTHCSRPAGRNRGRRAQRDRDPQHRRGQPGRLRRCRPRPQRQSWGTGAHARASRSRTTSPR